MRSREDLHVYQDRAYRHILNHPFSGLFLSLGLGKTITTLTAINDLLNWCEVAKPLIVAPRLVAEMVWTDEVKEWEHVSHLRISKIVGNAKQRKAALTAEADIWVIGRDNLPWLVDLVGEFWPFDMIVLDESTSFKSPQSLRFRKMKTVMKYVTRMVQLTGTPVPNGLLDLWAPLYLLDKGQRLGTTFTGFRNRYFEGNEYSHRYVPRKGAAESIHSAIGDICISMAKEDWLSMKPLQNVTRKVMLPNLDAYKKFEDEAVLTIPDGEITAVNAAALYMKLVQFCNGAVYDSEHNYHVVHDAKLDMLEEIIESLNGDPVIVFYCFQSDIARISNRIKNTVTLTGAKDPTSIKNAWNKGEIEVLIAHPASAGHGLNMQHGGHRIIWYGVPNPLEWYQQAVGRLDRQGQTESVINMHLITQGTIEETVVARLVDKTLTQDTLIEALKAFKADALEYKRKKEMASGARDPLTLPPDTGAWAQAKQEEAVLDDWLYS